MEKIGSDRVLVTGTRVIVHSRADMAGWEVRAFRRTRILFRGGHYFVAAKERVDGELRYRLERWPEDREDADGGVVEYGDDFVADREATRRARAAAGTVQRVLLPLYPLLGLLPGAVKKRLADGYGISEDLATTLSLWLEFLLTIALLGLFTIHSVAGAYGGALGVREPIAWLSNLMKWGMVLLVLIVPDLLMRYSKILGESRYPWGFWEWVFRRES